MDDHTKKKTDTGGEGETRKNVFYLVNGGVKKKSSKRWKTKLCWHFMSEESSCSWGDSCSFAHGRHELSR